MFLSRVIHDKDPEYPYMADVWCKVQTKEGVADYMVTYGRFKSFESTTDWLDLVVERLMVDPQKALDDDWLDVNIPPDDYEQIEALLHGKPV